MKLKISILSAAVLSIILAGLGSFLYFTVNTRILQLESSNLMNQSQTIAQYYSGHGVDTTTDDRTARAWLHRNIHHDQEVLFFGPSGKRITELGDLNSASLEKHFHPVDTPTQDTIFLKGITPVIYTTYPVTSSDGSHTVGYVVLAASIGYIPEYMESLLTVLLAGSVGAVLLAALGGYTIAAISLRPINHLVRVVEGIQANRLNERVYPVRGNDEVARLTVTFNRMLSRIERSFEQQSRFVADASHEIRTPLTTILGYANLLNRWGKTDPDVLDKSIHVIRKESQRLRNLADDLLLLAGLEAERGASPENAKMDEVAREVTEELSPLHTDIRVATDLLSDATVQMAQHHLKQIVTNLVANALKYTPVGGQIQVATGVEGNLAWFRITDTGCGISQEDLPHVFERFYRADKSRERSHGGNGLGLAIVKELVDSYHGMIDIESTEGVGTTVTLKLPCKSAKQREE